MRIALVIGNYDRWGGGAERWTDRHARMLLARGHEVHLVARTIRGAPEAARCEQANRRAAHRRRMSFGDEAESILRDLHANVIHDMGDGWYADLFMPHHGTRRGTFRQHTRQASPTLQRARRFAKRWVPRYREFRALERKQYDFGAGQLYLAVSDMIRQHMVQYYRVPEERIRVVHNGADTEALRPPTDAAARTRFQASLGAGDDRTLFLTVAHNFKLKGLDTLLPALIRLHREGRPVRLVVVGDGAIGQYQNLARSLGGEHLVHFTGGQIDPMPYYQAADVFVLPTWYDPCSLVVLEAMAAGLPIITTRNNGVHELMTRGREGLNIDEPAAEEALAGGMRVYCEPDRRARAGRAARALAERHSVTAMLEKHLQIYDEIIARKEAVKCQV